MCLWKYKGYEKRRSNKHSFVVLHAGIDHWVNQVTYHVIPLQTALKGLEKEGNVFQVKESKHSTLHSLD